MIVPNFFNDFTIAAMASGTMGIGLGQIMKSSTLPRAIWDEGENRLIGYEEEVIMEFIIPRKQVFTLQPAILTAGALPIWYTLPSNSLHPLVQFHNYWNLAITNNSTESYRTAIRALKEFFMLERNMFLNTTDYNVRNADHNPFNDPLVSGGTNKEFFAEALINNLKTLEINVEDFPGVQHLNVKWRFKTQRRLNNLSKVYARNANNDTTSSIVNRKIPIIATEIRLTVDDENDLSVIASGTLYGSSPELVLDGRRYLLMEFERRAFGTVTLSPPEGEEGPTFSYDSGTIVNGMKRTVEYNIEKNGLSAKFLLKYVTVKSNNAFPLGIKDIEFDQTIKSSLFGSDAFQGIGFRTWRNHFYCKIKLPPRMPAIYAWNICHNLMQQQLRKSTLIFSTLSTKEKESIDATIFNKTYDTCVFLPIAIKVKNRHFHREITFDVDYVTISPLSEVFSNTCILNRVNQHYEPDPSPSNPWMPVTLSEQWHKWNRSMNPRVEFHPINPTNNTPFSQHRRRPENFEDATGTIVVETGAVNQPQERLQDQSALYAENNNQRNIFRTTKIDPHDFDQDYNKYYQFNLPGFVPPNNTPATSFSQVGGGDTDLVINSPETIQTAINNQSLAGANPAVDSTGINQGVIERNTATPLPAFPLVPYTAVVSGGGTTYEADPAFTWVEYRQEYEIIEVNNTETYEALNQFTERDYINDMVFNKLNMEVDENGNLVQGATPTDVQLRAIQSGKVYTESKILGRKPKNADIVYTQLPSLSEDPEETETVSINSRKTVASRPSRFFLVVTGYAMRAYYKIPIPEVLMIAGKPAMRYGTFRSKMIPINSSSDIPMSLAMWEQTYTIDSELMTEDVLSSIVTTGASILYV